jgi:hypothetical protein
MSSCNASQAGFVMHHRLVTEIVPPDHLLLDSAPNIGPLIPWWKLDKLKNCWNKSFRTFKILTLVSAIFEPVNFPTRYEWFKIRGTVH